MSGATVRKSARVHSDPKQCLQEVMKKVGMEIILGIPLGLGKPVQFVNLLYQEAKQNPDLKLTILTALTLERPKGKSQLERRFLDPFVKRVFGDYPDLDYELDRMNDLIPPNVRIIEFYYPAGKFMNNPVAQQNYISSNYTHVARDLLDRKVNVIAQLVAMSKDHQTLSLSCNADVTPDIIHSKARKDIFFVAQVNNNLPYMYGEAEVSCSEFDCIIQNPELEFKLFGPPKLPVSDVDYMIGLYASTLIRDDGELQIGIGSLGDSLIYSLLMRHQNNEQYNQVLDSFWCRKKFGEAISAMGGMDKFEKGLFGATEMLVDSLMYLVDNGIMKRKVYDHVILQRLINEDLIDERKLTGQTLFLLVQKGAINPKLTAEDFDFLQEFGIFKKNISYEYGKIYLPDESAIEADLNIDDCTIQIIEKCMGTKLKNGAIIHAGFFLGPAHFYQWLRDLPEEKKRQIHMKSVRKINQLYGHEEIDRLHRKNARFVNTCLMMTLSGAAVSDGLEDGRVVSGVGGQYNFVDMAHALPDGRSILQLRSTRKDSAGCVRSNIVWNYGHITIPRHLRDIVITEYGIADLRGKTDEEIAMSLIQIADSRFQDKLIKQAQSAGKLAASYVLPEHFRHNTPRHIWTIMKEYKKQGFYPSFPFGTNFTKEEQLLGKALKSLRMKMNSTKSRLVTILRAMKSPAISDECMSCLSRMKLERPANYRDRLYRNLVANEIEKVQKSTSG